MQKLCHGTTCGLKTHLFLKSPFAYYPLCHFSLITKTKLSKSNGNVLSAYTNFEMLLNQYQITRPYCLTLEKHMKCIESAASDDFDKQFDPSVHTVTEHAPEETPIMTVGVIPGKGPPPEPPVDCCMSGCANCVWIAYGEALKEYYNDGDNAAKLAVEKIENPSLKMFVKLELGLL